MDLNESVITKQDLPALTEQVMLRLLQESPAIKYQLRGMMVETFAEKTDLQAILERIDKQGERIDAQGERIEALREDFNRQFTEHSKRMDHFAEVQVEHSKRMDHFAEVQAEHSKRMDHFAEVQAEHSKRMDHFAEVQAEHSKRMDHFAEVIAEHSKRMDHFAEVQAEHSERLDILQENFNRGFNLLSERIELLSKEIDHKIEQASQETDHKIDRASQEIDHKIDRASEKVHIQLSAMGARWGTQSESAFREGLAHILTRETNLNVVRYEKTDLEGVVFGHPSLIEIDVAIQNGEHILIEIKSSISRSDVYVLTRKAAFYEQKEGVKIKQIMIISPMLAPGARDLADDMEIDIFTSPYQVNV